MSECKKWYAVYTRPRWEKKVAETLSRRKVENYCPINKVVRQWSDRKKIVYEPLFTSYVFVHVSDAEMVSLKQTNGVINLVYWLGKPAVIIDSEIDAIKKFLCDHVNVTLEKTPITVSDSVRILGGPLMELEGQVLSVKNKTVKVVLPSLGYMMFAEVETANVEVIVRTIAASERQLRYPKYATQ